MRKRLQKCLEKPMRESLLQDYVIPICSAERFKGSVSLRQLLGTAFFINNAGVFLTAKHVLQQIDKDTSGGVDYGLCVKSQNATAADMFAPLKSWEVAPEPYDIAIGTVDAGSRAWFSRPEESRATPWKDVATLGYPETALNTSAGNFNVHPRMLKGYIQRLVDAGEIDLIAPHPICYELSFPVTSGVSGAPLFATNNNRQDLIGVCVGSYSAEVTDYRSTYVDDDGSRHEERSVKVEQIGIAECIFSLLEWTPGIFGQQSLAELVSPSEHATS